MSTTILQRVNLMSTNDAFMLFFKGLARHAPGADESTLTALAACELPPDPVICDLGAGTGSSALVLAEHLQTKVVAVDQISNSLDELQTRADRRGYGHLIETVEGDFLALDVEPGSVDLIWSEGAIYAVGWDAALEAWRPLLRPGGYVVVTDCVWVTDERPAEAVEFWSREYPEMTTAAALAEFAGNAGFEVVDTFELPRRAWADYYGPLGQRVALVNSGDPSDEMREVADAVEVEIAVWETHGHAFNYAFFVLRRAR